MPYDVIGDWDYTGIPYKYQLYLTEEQFEFLGDMGFLQGSVLVQQAPRYWDRAVVLAAGAIAWLKEILKSDRRPFPTVDELKWDCQPGKLVAEPAAAVRFRSGNSIEQEYICPYGTFTVHWIENNGHIIHGPHFVLVPQKGRRGLNAISTPVARDGDGCDRG